MMNKHFYLFSILTSLPVTTFAAVDCATPPTCSELGYTDDADDCDTNGMLKCPLDKTKVSCRSYKPVTCTVGSFLASDMKCYAKIPAGKIIIGIVFDTSYKLAVSLNTKTTLPWLTNSNYIYNLGTCASDSYNTCKTDGAANTKEIVNYMNGNYSSIAKDSYAAGYCATKTDGLPAGNWFLPSMKEIKSLYQNRTKVNASLSSIGDTITSSNYWTSNQGPSSNFALIFLWSGDFFGGSSKSGTQYTRCIMKYQ